MKANFTKKIRIRHHFTTAYYPSEKRTIEILDKELLRVAHALLSEWKMLATQWLSIVDSVQKVINQSFLQRLVKAKTDA